MLFFGDVSGYCKVSVVYDIIYQQVYQYVCSGIMVLCVKVGLQMLLVIFVYFLGGYIVFNFIWDQQKFNCMLSCLIDFFFGLEILVGLVIFGCNILLFIFVYEKVCLICFFGYCLFLVICQQVCWLNVYVLVDLFGYLLWLLQNYVVVVYEDFVLLVGFWYKWYILLSYMEYWNDVCFYDYLVDYLCCLLVVGFEFVGVGCVFFVGELGDWLFVEFC